MNVLRLMGALPLVALLAACDTPLDPELGSTLDPDGAKALVASAGSAGASVTGGGWRSTDPDDPTALRHFSITAGNRGGTVSGRYNLVTGSSDIVVRGDVTCLTVVDGRAWVGGTIDKTELPFPPEIVAQLTGIAVELVDHGNGSGVDELSALGLFVNDPEGPQRFCDDADPGPVDPVDRGSYQVR
jgi:hypothetical protein